MVKNITYKNLLDLPQLSNNWNRKLSKSKRTKTLKFIKLYRKEGTLNNLEPSGKKTFYYLRQKKRNLISTHRRNESETSPTKRMLMYFWAEKREIMNFPHNSTLFSSLFNGNSTELFGNDLESSRENIKQQVFLLFSSVLFFIHPRLKLRFANKGHFSMQ